MAATNAAASAESETDMRLNRILMMIGAVSMAARWTEYFVRRNRDRDALRSVAKPVPLQQWEGEGGALQGRGPQLTKPVRPTLESEPNRPTLASLGDSNRAVDHAGWERSR